LGSVEDAELDESVHVRRVDARPLGQELAIDPLHHANDGTDRAIGMAELGKAGGINFGIDTTPPGPAGLTGGDRFDFNCVQAHRARGEGGPR
jgi:hypothetical protein